MTPASTVDAFFSAYDEMVRRKWPGSVPLPSEIDFLDLYQLRPPLLSPDDLARVEADAGALPETYKRFMAAHSFKELDLEPWIQFPPSSSAGLKVVARLRRDTGDGLVPFATDIVHGGVFGFDRRGRTDAEMPIALWLKSYPIAPDRIEKNVILSPLASSFDRLLEVLTRVIVGPELLWVRPGESATAGQIALANEIRSRDPEGFGGPGWRLWWGQNVVNVPTR
jgi:hypothetical protein